MTPELLLKTGILPALSYLRGHGIEDKMSARRMLVAIAMQESNLAHRRQVSSDGTESGPAVSFYQAELTGAGYWLLRHAVSGPILKKACADFNITATPQGVWDAIRYNDVFASIVARLNLFVLPSAMAEAVDIGWKQYLSAWRPGKPHESTWPTNWSAADIIVKANP